MKENEIIAYVWEGTTSGRTNETHFYLECYGLGKKIIPEQVSLSSIARLINKFKNDKPEVTCRIKTVPQESLIWIPYEKQFLACRKLSDEQVEELLELLNK